MTEEQQSTITRLRSQGLSCVKIGKQIGVSESTVWKFLNPKPKQPSQKLDRKYPPADNLPRTLYHGSVPIRRRQPIPSILRELPKESREELYQRLAAAVRNTAQMR